MDISFRRFSEKYWWLFLIAVLVPCFLIGGYCLVYHKSSLDQTIWATIISSIVSYIGTIAWGVFIFYDSWQRRIEQEYRERPILSVKATLSDKGPLFYQMYEKQEVEEKLNFQVEIHGIKQTQQKLHEVKYVHVSITNYGLSPISNISLVDVYLDANKKYIHQGKYGYISSLDCPITLFCKDKWEAYVAIDETLFYKLPKGMKQISVYFKLKQNTIETYYVVVTINTSGCGSFGQDVNIIKEAEFNKLLSQSRGSNTVIKNEITSGKVS